jgi:hypothetical protein
MPNSICLNKLKKTENMKKLFFVFVIAATFAACNGSEETTTSTETSAPAPDTTIVTPAPTDTTVVAPSTTDAAPSTTAK